MILGLASDPLCRLLAVDLAWAVGVLGLAFAALLILGMWLAHRRALRSLRAPSAVPELVEPERAERHSSGPKPAEPIPLPSPASRSSGPEEVSFGP